MAEDLDANYARAGYHHRLGFGARPALLLIDFVQAYFEPSSPLYAGVDAALEQALLVLEAARRRGILVVFTNVTYRIGAVDGGIFRRKVPALACMEEGNPLGGWPAGLAPRAGELVLSKQYPSAFFGTSLASTLTANRIDSVLLTGLTTSGCVRATCVDAMSHGFIPIVIEDACGDRAIEPHKANIFDMSAKYADVIDACAAIAYLGEL
ncbi:isochorismatase family protein [Labrys monachus]|uniref:Maleamate amidohydrolase n=1 Tax=Labrys monachus TaxID=217067 RepID=A0ABU0FFF7_9HYPH|nr:isochorismatase family protein [Labrys monachus]MDQ0393341.1 maleamate amidohydrolase [Labrys monachus]